MPKTLAETKHFKLAQQVRREIGRMRAGDPLPTVEEMKSTYGVSQATVERAVGRLRREGLIVRHDGQLRPVVAERSDPATHRVAIIRPDYPSPTFEELARVLSDAGKECDWAMETVYYRKLDNVSLRRDIGDNDAAILVPSTEAFPPSLMAALRRPQRPVVVIQDPPAGLRVSSVRIDDELIGRKAVKHLAALGHRRILLFLSEPMAPSGELRAAGWREQMEAIGETNLDGLVVDSHLKPFDFSIGESYEYFSKWLDAPHPEFTAVFCACCTGAIAVLRALREKGISVPEDVSVISHGGEGSMAPFLYPALTAMETDIPAYGRAVVEVLLNQLENPSEPTKHIAIPSTLVIRDTTGQCCRRRGGVGDGVVAAGANVVGNAIRTGRSTRTSA